MKPIDNRLPCPFCGNQPSWYGEALEDDHFYIKCDTCQFVIKADRRDKVIGIWNNRILKNQIEDELKRLAHIKLHLAESETKKDHRIEGLKFVLELMSKPISLRADLDPNSSDPF